MAGYVKCQFCQGHVHVSKKDTLVKETKVSSSGKTKNDYWHPECYPKELENREFKRIEREKKDALNETVKQIYNIKFDLPVRWWEYIADMREGTNRYQKFWKKKRKEGVPYDVIREAFILSIHDIEWARMNKRFSNLEQELRYGLIIMQGKINDAYRKIKAREQQEKRNEAMEEILIEDMRDNREVSFKRVRKDNKDYSYLLGDD